MIEDDIDAQESCGPRRLPRDYAGNVFRYNAPSRFQHYGAPHYGGADSQINPPLSAEELRLHFMFGPDKIPEVLDSLRLVAIDFKESNMAYRRFRIDSQWKV